MSWFRFHVKSLLPVRLCAHYRNLKSSIFVGSFTVPVALSCNIHHLTENPRKLSYQISTCSVSCIQKACRSSISSIDELLSTVGKAVLNAGSQYKNSLNKLIYLLQEFEILQSQSLFNDDIEDNIVATRAQIVDHKKEFVELITIMENIETLAAEASKVSFLMSLESAAISISETISDVRNIVSSELAEIQSIENNLYKIERNVILRKLEE